MAELDQIGVLIASPTDMQTMMEDGYTGQENNMGEGEEDKGPELSSLASHIINQFTINKDAKQTSGVEEEIFKSLRDYNGKYSPEDSTRIEMEGGSKIFMNLTATKSKAAMSWIRDILLAANEDAFSLSSTPVPSLPTDLEQQLEEAFKAQFENQSQQLMQNSNGPVTPVS